MNAPQAQGLFLALWDHWERHPDPDLHIDRSLKGAVAGKVVLVTGGSSGIGLAAAHKYALVPRVAQIAMNARFRMFPDSSTAKGGKGAGPQLSAQAVALQQMMRGIHF